MHSTMLAQTSSAAGDDGNGDTTIEIDPSASDAITVNDSEAEAPEPEVAGSVETQLNELVPESGSPTVDGAVNQLTVAVGRLVDGMIGLLPQLLIAVIVLIVTFFLVRLIDKVIHNASKRARVRGSLQDIFRLFGRIVFWFTGGMVAAGIVFPSFGFGQLVATAGLASIAIGFAFQDIFENFFAGILILLRFPFENGDFIEVGELMGKVEDVEIRSTHIRQPSGELVIVPNSMIFKNKVTILTNRAFRRLELSVGIAYGEDVAEGREVILKAVKSCDTVLNHAEPEALASGFGASSIDFDVIWWADSKPLETRRSRDQVVEAVKKALDDAGIEIPYPYRTLTFTKNEPDIMQAFANAGRGTTGSDRDASNE